MSESPIAHIGPYEILGSLGHGGMGEIYRARDSRLGREVALKVINDRWAQDADAVERLIREARAASALNHPNIVTVHEISEDAGRRFIVMEFIKGQTLRAVMGEAWALDRFRDVAAQIARALAAAHAAGIVHRDIKPENIMVREDGYVKVVDFGIARLVPVDDSDTAMTMTATGGPIFGTPRYMSPERIGGGEVTSQSDIFSFGVVAYEWATGRNPFAGANAIDEVNAIRSVEPVTPSRVNPEVPPALDALIHEMIQKDTGCRPTAIEIIDRLAELPGASAARAAVVAAGPGAPHSWVGRARESMELHLAFDQVAGGHSVLVGLSGEPGIGKTTLIEHVLHDLAAGGVSYYLARGRCSERLAGTEAYLPFLEAFDSLLHGGGRETIVRLFKSLAPSWYLQLAEAGARGEREMKATSQERLKRELLAVLEELSKLRPLVLFFDDVHWADASTVDLLSYIAARFERLRVLVVASYRPSDLQLARHPFLAVMRDLQGRDLAREIAIDFLNRDDLAAYLSLTFQNHRFPLELVSLIHDKTEGNPLFMVDLVRDLRDRNVIVRAGEGWELTKAVSEIAHELPASIRGLIQRKIDSLEEEARRFLVTASVQGVQFDTAVVARALEIDPARLEEQLDRLERAHGFVRLVGELPLPDGTPSSQYRFVHALYQNGLYGSLRPVRRATLSMSVAQAILAFYGEHGAVSELALLFETARDFPRAVDYFRRAASNALRVSAYTESELLARRGLTVLGFLPESPERDQHELALLVAFGVALSATKSYASPEVGEAYARARRLAERSASPYIFPVLHGLYRFYFVRAQLDDSLELSRQLIERAESAGDAGMLLEAHRAMGNSLFYRGHLDDSRRHLESAIRLFDPALHRSHIVVYGIDPAVASRTVVALATWNAGHPDKARERMREADARARELRHAFTLAWMLSYSALLYHNCGDVQATRTASEECLQLSTEYAFPFWLAGAIIMGARAAFDGGGDEGEALGRLRQGIDAWYATGARINTPYYLTLHAEALLAAGCLNEARQTIEEALASADRHIEKWWQAEHYRVYGQILLKVSTPAESPDPKTEAEVWLLKAFEVARQQGARSLQLRAAITIARLRRMQGRAEEGLLLLRDVYESFTEGFDTADLRTAAELLR